jgi:hypothetical protein
MELTTTAVMIGPGAAGRRRGRVAIGATIAAVVAVVAVAGRGAGTEMGELVAAAPLVVEVPAVVTVPDAGAAFVEGAAVTVLVADARLEGSGSGSAAERATPRPAPSRPHGVGAGTTAVAMRMDDERATDRAGDEAPPFQASASATEVEQLAARRLRASDYRVALSLIQGEMRLGRVSVRGYLIAALAACHLGELALGGVYATRLEGKARTAAERACHR